MGSDVWSASRRGRTVADFSLGLSTRPPRLQTNVPSDLRHDAGVADGMRWRAPGGWTVEIVHLTGTSDHSDGERLRVCQYGWFTADVRTMAELERFFPLADLEPDGLSLHWGRAQTKPSPW
jgi:hypothetical protein